MGGWVVGERLVGLNAETGARCAWGLGRHSTLTAAGVTAAVSLRNMATQSQQ